MGQKLGRAVLSSAAEPYSNISRQGILRMWQAFNDIADGFGLSQDEFEEISTVLTDELNVTRLAMIGKAAALFQVLDTDKNGLVDALEFVSTVAVLSGMRLTEIIDFVLNSYDFDGTNILSIDELTLALKSIANGLSKISSLPFPREELIEQLVSTLFVDCLGKEANDSMRVRISILTDMLLAHPDIQSWFSFFGNPTQLAIQVQDILDKDRDYTKEGEVRLRSNAFTTATAWDVRCKTVAEDTLNNPWLNSVAMLTPIQYANTLMRKLAPDASLNIEWVYGYQSETCRNNVYYNYQGNMVYHTGKYAIVYEFDNQKQNIYTGHNEEIWSIAMHPSNKFIATGDSGNIPMVTVWNSSTHEILFSDNKFHRNGIIHLAFSCDGKQLATIGNDAFHSLAIFLWEENRILFTTHVHSGQVLGCAFLPDNTIAVCGESYLTFWCTAHEGYIKRRGNYSRFTKLQPITCVVHVGTTDTLVTGTISGQLFLWADRNCIRNVKGHEGCVNALFSCAHGLLSGGVDRRIRLWTHKLEPGASFDMSNFGFDPCIRAVCMSSDGTSILVGTKSSNIFEISAVDGSGLRGGPVACGHFSGCLRFLVNHPSKTEFATVGDDRHLRVWGMHNHTLLKVAVFDAEVHTLTYSPLGDIIAVGLGGNSGSKCGAFVILNEEDLSVVHEARDSTSPITFIGFSNEGETLAVAAADGAIYLYAVQDEYELIGRCVRHTAAVTQIDFSADGEWIRSNSMERDICFFNTDDGSYQSNLSSMRDVQWGSHTCKYSWHNKAIHKTCFDNEEVTVVHTPSAAPMYVASGSSFGYIRLAAFPCLPDDVEYHRYPAHVDAISGLRFSFDEHTLMSSGLKDRTIIQWHCSTYAEEDVAVDVDGNESDDFGLEARAGSDLEEDFIPVSGSLPESVLNAGDRNDTKEVPPSPSVDAWLESVVAPVNPPIQHPNIPDMSVRIEYAHGFSCQTMRNNIRYTAEGSLVYVCSTFGVNMHRTTKAQKFYQRHTDAISAFAVSRDGRYAVTGQIGYHPIVCVWDSHSCETLVTLSDVQSYSVCAVNFSYDQSYVAVVSADQFHTISIYNWRSNSLVSRFYGGINRIMHVSFSDDGEQFVSVGVKVIKFWTNFKTRNPTSLIPKLGEIGAKQPYLCSIFFNDKPTVGCSDGNLYVFVGKSLRHAVKAHQGPVNAMDVSRDGKFLVTGGKDGAARIWSTALEVLKEISVDSLITSQCTRVRSVAFSHDGNNIIIGTRGAEIIEVGVKSGTMLGKPLLQGHGMRELWGLATHPTKDEFITSGDDATIRVWDSKTFHLIKTIRMDTASRAIAYSPNGKYVAVGFGFGKRSKGRAAAKEGAFAVLTASDMKIAHEGKDSLEPIRVVRFSPDNNFLVVGSEDSCIYVYNTKDQFSRRSIATCHKAPVMTIDFNLDGSFMMSTDSSKRICFSETATGTHIISPAALRDEKWATWSAPFGWPVQGVWMAQPIGIEPCAAQRSSSGQLLCVGNSGGRMSVVHYPCPERAGFVGTLGHSGPISQIGWIAGDGALVTIGAKDFTILQWKCIYDQGRESADEGGISCQDSEVDISGGNEFSSKDIVKYTNLFGSVMPWQQVVVPPVNVVEDVVSTANINMDLEFIQGIRIGDCRENVRYNVDGCILYIVVTMGVIYSREEHKQRIYAGHKNQLISIDVDATGKIAATGEIADNPELHLWDARTTHHIITFTNVHKKGIGCISFSSSGRYLVSLGQDTMNSIVVYYSATTRWVDGYIQSSISVSSNRIFWTTYVEGNDYPVVAGGHASIFFYRTVCKTAEKVKGIFGKKRKLQPILCCVEGHADGSANRAVLTGTVTGHIYVWLNQKVETTVTAHDAPVLAITKVMRGFATGGKDGLIKIWSSSLKLLHQYNTMQYVPKPLSTAVHCLRSNQVGSRLSFGMRSGELYEISLPTHSYMMLVDGHSNRQLHGIAPNPANSDEYVTVGDDGILRIWSILRKNCLRRLNIEVASRAVAWSADGTRLIVGVGGDAANATKDGAYFVIDAKSLEIILEDRKAKQYITDIKFSPKNDTLAMSSYDGRVYIHNPIKYTLLRTLEIPTKNTGVTRFDFSLDATIIRLATSANELMYFNIDDGQIIISPNATRDVEWSTTTCPYTWMTQGAVRPTVEGITICAVCVSPRNDFVLVSYINGDVRLYNFPCQTAESQYLLIRGVATQSSRIIFSSDGKYLLVLDTYTRAILQYKIDKVKNS